MEALISNQLAQKEIIEKFIKNYKKDGQQRRTQTYYEKKLNELQEQWDEFKRRHKEILVLKYTEKGAEEKYDYLKKDIFSEVEEFFMNNYALIEDRFKTEYSNKEKPSKSSELLDPGTGNSSASIKLPKISLEKFNGDYRKWPTFHDLFKTLVHENKSLSPVQKMQYLKLHLHGEPEHLLRHLQVTESNYQAAWDLLNDRYDNKRVLINTHLKVLFSQNAVSSESAPGIKGLLDTTMECLQALKNLDIKIENWDAIIVYLLVQKLPKETHELWEQEVSKAKTLPSWDELRKFLEVRFRTLEAVSTKKAISKDHYNQNNKSKVYPHTSQSFHITSKTTCLNCLGNHSIRHCPKFLSLDSLKRLDIVKSKGLCLNCLGSGHLLPNCPSQQKCFHCKQPHHSLLHRKSGENSRNDFRSVNQQNTYKTHSRADGIPEQNLNSKNTNNLTATTSNQTFSVTAPEFIPNQVSADAPNISSFFATENPRTQILLATALMKIVSSSGEEQVVRALIDQGSQGSFITESVVQSLKLKKESVNAEVQGIGKSVVSHAKAKVNFTIKPLKGDDKIEVSGLVLRKLTHLLPSTAIAFHKWDHIEGLELADPHFYNPGQIDVLLGAEVYSQIIADGLIKGMKGTPVAQRTVLGWILSGEAGQALPHTVSVHNFHLRADLNEQLKSFWELEEVSHSKCYTEEEEACENLFLKTFKRLPNGRYEVELPFKEENAKSCLGKCYQCSKFSEGHHVLRAGYIEFKWKGVMNFEIEH